MFSAAMGIPAPPQVFQTYLLPSLPFRRRKSSTETVDNVPSLSSASSSPTTPSSPALASPIASPITPLSPASPSPYDLDYSPFSLFAHNRISSIDSVDSSPAHSASTNRPSYLSGATSHISCSRCHADLALTSQIISKGFTGRHGRAYLVAASPSPLSPTLASARSSNSSTCATDSLPNTHTHKAVPRHLVTGLHTVCDISCAMCGSVLGWKYVHAEEESQRYKVGKFILETRRVAVGSCWENDGLSSDEADDDDAVADREGKNSSRYDFQSRRRSSTRRDQRHRSSSSGSGLGLGSLGLGGLGLAFGVLDRPSQSHSPPPDEDEDDNEEDRHRDREDDEEVMFDSQDDDECEDLFAGVWSPKLALYRRKKKLGIR